MHSQTISTMRISGGSPRAGALSARPMKSVRPLHLRFAPLPTPKISELNGRCASMRLIKCNGLFGLGLPEIAVIAGIAALVFGPSKLPELGKGLGQTVKSFQTAAKEFETELKTAAASEDDKEDEKKKKDDAPKA